MEGNMTIVGKAHTDPAVYKMLLWFMIGITCVGVSGAVYGQFVGYHHAMATTREMPWGMLIGGYAYFAIISTGLCVLAAFSHAFGGNQMAPLANRMVWLSIIVLLGAFTVIGLEIDNPWRMPLGVILHPNVTSNIWWMGTLYGMAIGIMGLELFLIITKKYKLAVFLGALAAVTEALANSNLGSVFGSLSSRPFWYGSQLPIFFLASAVLSGAAAIVMFTHFSHTLHKRKMSDVTFNALQTAGKIMVLMTFLVGLATAWKFANAYCGTEEMRLAADSLVSGPLSTSFWLFEIGIGVIFPCILLVLSRLNSIQALSTASLMVLVGQFFSRFNLVVAGQIISTDHGKVGIPDYLSYVPSSTEFLILLAGLGVLGLGFVAGEKVLDSVFNDSNNHC